MASRSTRGTSASCARPRRPPAHPATLPLLGRALHGPYQYAEDRLDEVINRRKLPGEGELPVAGYVAVCRELGYDGPWGVEVLSEELRSLPIEQIFERAYETTTAQLALASERSPGG